MRLACVGLQLPQCVTHRRGRYESTELHRKLSFAQWHQQYIWFGWKCKALFNDNTHECRLWAYVRAVLHMLYSLRVSRTDLVNAKQPRSCTPRRCWA